MDLFAIKTEMMLGSEVIAVFSHELYAKNFLKKNSLPTAKLVILPLIGGKIKINTVYAAHRYDRLNDIHKFDALFTDYDEAKEFSGEDSLVKNLQIDGRLNES